MNNKEIPSPDGLLTEDHTTSSQEPPGAGGLGLQRAVCGRQSGKLQYSKVKRKTQGNLSLKRPGGCTSGGDVWTLMRMCGWSVLTPARSPLQTPAAPSFFCFERESGYIYPSWPQALNPPALVSWVLGL